ncbi:MAG TPA: nitrilase-related carbon-nitrogen hydrolase, partial [Candidatus Polarisedimenticolia bacterium]|nr:nitrilase-related carbon-nitrogen hydrolase [Candidatus Polarisedimenticolia bacterium]
MRAALAQVAPLLGNLDGNLRMHRRIVQAALRAQCDLVVFPELSLTGYLLQDLVPEIAVRPEKDSRIRDLLKLSRRIAIVVGLVEESEDHRFYNTALFLAQGKILHRHRKVYLPTYGMFDEAREFSSGEGFSAFSTPLGRFGILICEDAWHPSSAYLLARDGADYLLVLSSGPSRGIGSGRELFSTSSWTDLCRVTARFQTVYVAYVNRVGVEDGMHFSGASFVANPLGEMTYRAEEIKEALLLATLSRAPLRRARTMFPLLRDERPDLVLKELQRITGLDGGPSHDARPLR